MKTYIISHILFIILFGGLIFSAPQKEQFNTITTDYQEDAEPFLCRVGNEVYFNDYNGMFTLTHVDNANDLYRYFVDSKGERAIIDEMTFEGQDYIVVWHEKTDKYYFSLKFLR